MLYFKQHTLKTGRQRWRLCCLLHRYKLQGTDLQSVRILQICVSVLLSVYV